MRVTSAFGFILGLAGAFLDLLSGYLILSNSMMPANDMNIMIPTYSSTGLAWSIGLFALGALLLVSVLVSSTNTGMSHMGLVGGLMILYGFVMMLIGGAMLFRVTPMMSDYLSSSTGMFVVGALMIVNGSFMRRNEM